MNTTIYQVGTTAILGSLIAFVACTASAATADTHPTDKPVASCGCFWTVDQLPHTPDAVEGWYKRC